MLTQITNVVVDLCASDGTLVRSMVRPVHTDGAGGWAVRVKGNLLAATAIGASRLRVTRGVGVADESRFRPARNTDVGRAAPAETPRALPDVPAGAARATGLFKAQLTRQIAGARVKPSTIAKLRSAALAAGASEAALVAVERQCGRATAKPSARDALISAGYSPAEADKLLA